MKNKKEGFTSRVGLFLLLVTFCLGTVQAQSSKITGYVKDQSGEPLIGVNVMEKGRKCPAWADPESSGDC